MVSNTFAYHFRYNRYFNKTSGCWSVHPVKEQKSYQHIKELAWIALSVYVNYRTGMKRGRIRARRSKA